MPTTRIPQDFKEFLKLLDAHEARFLLIGGYAVNAFGDVRNTADMDIWIGPDWDNQVRSITAYMANTDALAGLTSLDFQV